MQNHIRESKLDENNASDFAPNAIEEGVIAENSRSFSEHIEIGAISQKIDITTIRPAKRIIVLYALLFCLILSSILFAVRHIQLQFGLDPVIISIIFKAILFIGIPLLSYVSLWRLTSVYKISSECVTSTTGILSKSHIRIPINRIVDYRVLTPLFERILGIGSIKIDTAGDDDLLMEHISKNEIALVAIKLNKLLNKQQLVGVIGR